jgi:hypothetical protein
MCGTEPKNQYFLKKYTLRLKKTKTWGTNPRLTNN